MGIAVGSLVTAIVSIAGTLLVARNQFRHKLAEVRADRRRDVYTRLLRYLLDLERYFADAGESLRVGILSIPPAPAETMHGFEAELLIDGSNKVRDLIGEFAPTFARFLHRLNEIAESDMNDPSRPTAAEHVNQAFGETIRPLVDTLANVMRAELT
jgi:hypothetical protein